MKTACHGTELAFTFEVHVLWMALELQFFGSLTGKRLGEIWGSVSQPFDISSLLFQFSMTSLQAARHICRQYGVRGVLAGH